MFKKFIKKIACNIVSKKYCELYSIIGKYDYISFDIFDTLIKRDVRNPVDIYDVVERRYGNLINFKEERINAEKKAKLNSKNEEINLEDIYSYLNYDEKIKNELLKLEIEVEKNYCIKNKEMFEIYKYCLNNNKKIFITSDMYLPKKLIEDILEKNDYKKYSKLYLSSEYKLTKRSGNLFRQLLKEENIKPNQLVHIGDSLLGDYLKLKKLRIKSVLIRKNTNNTMHINFKNKTLDYNILSSFINNRIDYNNDVYSKFGYEIFGPILYSFTTWLHNQIKENKIDKIYFLARDAKIIMNVYNKRFKENIPIYYINTSRKSIIFANLEYLKDFDDLIFKYRSIIKGTSRLIDLINTLNFDCNKYESLFKFYDKQIMNLTYDEKNIIFDNIKEDIKKVSKEQKNYLKEYLKQNDFNGNIAIVDIGWNGTIQYYLEKYTDKSTKLFGYYYGVQHNNLFNEMKKLNRTGYFFNYSDNYEYQSVISLSVGVFESMFLSTEASTTGYHKVNNYIEPIYGIKDNSKSNIILIENIQNGAKQFITDTENSSIKQDLLYLDKISFFENYKKFAVDPSARDIELFKNIYFQDFEKRKLINNKSLLYYIFHLKHFYTDFMNSVCKVMFMKSVFKVKFPYYKILRGLYIKEKNKIRGD